MEIMYTGLLDDNHWDIDVENHNFTLILRQQYDVNVLSQADINFTYLWLAGSAEGSKLNVMYDWDHYDRACEYNPELDLDVSKYDMIVGNHSSLANTHADRFVEYPLWAAAISHDLLGGIDDRPHRRMCNNTLPLANFFKSVDVVPQSGITTVFSNMEFKPRLGIINTFSSRLGVIPGKGTNDKNTFIKGYKFHLSLENYHDFQTEKIVQPLAAGIIPIYWANDRIFEYINKDRVVWLAQDMSNLEEVIDEIKTLDEDDNKYLEKVNKPIFVNNTFPEIYTPPYILEQFKRILDL